MIYSRIFTEAEMRILRDALIEYWQESIKHTQPGPYRAQVQSLKDQFKGDLE